MLPRDAVALSIAAPDRTMARPVEISALNRTLAVAAAPGLRRISYVSRAQLRGHLDRLDSIRRRDRPDADALRELRQRDREVRQHEQAHSAAAGRHASGPPRLQTITGPDGRVYAVGGEVGIDASPVPGDPGATIEKMRQVRRAALAPATPSAQDRRVAAEASREEAAARSELREEAARGPEPDGFARRIESAYRRGRGLDGELRAPGERVDLRA